MNSKIMKRWEIYKDKNSHPGRWLFKRIEAFSD